MATLHIEHPITDFDAWQAAFDRFAQFRVQSGVRTQRVHRPIDDDRFVVIQLDFDTRDEARSFLHVLRTTVWAQPDNSPALAGTPVTKILELVPPPD